MLILVVVLRLHHMLLVVLRLHNILLVVLRLHHLLHCILYTLQLHIALVDLPHQGSGCQHQHESNSTPSEDHPHIVHTIEDVSKHSLSYYRFHLLLTKCTSIQLANQPVGITHLVYNTIYTLQGSLD